MPRLILDRSSEPLWFNFVEGVDLLVRDADAAAVRQARARAGLSAFAPRNERLSAEQAAALSIELIDHMVVDWKGIELADGTAAPCDRQHKELLAARHLVLSERIPLWAATVYGQTAVRLDAERGNSSGSSSGESSTSDTSVTATATTPGASAPSSSSSES